jgi:hypothetical protein
VAARTIEGVGCNVEADGGEAVEDGGDGAPTGADGVEGSVTALEGTGLLTTVAVASRTGLAWLPTVFSAPLRRPPTGVSAMAGAAKATVPISAASTARQARAVNGLEECSALRSIAGMRRVLVASRLSTRIDAKARKLRLSARLHGRKRPSRMAEPLPDRHARRRQPVPDRGPIKGEKAPESLGERCCHSPEPRRNLNKSEAGRFDGAAVQQRKEASLKRCGWGKRCGKHWLASPTAFAPETILGRVEA